MAKDDILTPSGGEDMARRRSQRKGYLFRRGPSWFLQYRTDSPDRDDKGRLKRVTLTKFVAPAEGPGKVGKREAERIAWSEYLSKLDQASTRPQSMRTLREFVTERFEPDHVWTLKPSGKAHYENMLKNHVLPALGSLRIRDITPPHVVALVKETIAAGKSVQTAHHVKNTISAVFRYAKALGWFSGDLPTEGISMPKMQHKERGALTWAQVVALTAKLPEAVLPKSTLGDKRDAIARQLLQQYTVLLFLLAVSGLRVGEAIGLQWQHLNATEGPVPLGKIPIPPHCIFVNRSYTRKPKRFRVGADDAGTPKSDKGRRLIPIPAWLESMLLRLQSRGTWIAPSDPIFASASGTPLNANNVEKRVLKKAGELAGMPWVSFHWFRHTASSLLEQAGATTKERQELIGHASEAMQLHYTHASMDRMRAVMERMVDPAAANLVMEGAEKGTVQ